MEEEVETRVLYQRMEGPLRSIADLQCVRTVEVKMQEVLLKPAEKSILYQQRVLIGILQTVLHEIQQELQFQRHPLKGQKMKKKVC